MKRKTLIILTIIVVGIISTWYFDIWHKPVETVDELIGKNITRRNEVKKLLNRIFGKNLKKRQVDKKSLDEILQLENKTEIIIEIGQLLWNKSRNDKDFESLNVIEKNILFIEMLESQVNNGGFDQYFFNSSGEYAHETLSALEEIMAPQMAKILNSAINVFPTLPIPKDTELRRDQMKEIPDSVSETWDKLDDKFYEYPEDLAELVIEYVKANKKEFE